jgi:hypothetical protein
MPAEEVIAVEGGVESGEAACEAPPSGEEEGYSSGRATLPESDRPAPAPARLDQPVPRHRQPTGTTRNRRPECYEDDRSNLNIDEE